MIDWRLTNRRLLLSPPLRVPAWTSHAQAPTVLKLSDDRWIIYFAGRDAQNCSRVYAADLDPATLSVREVHHRPALDIGRAGAFDEHGVGAATAILEGNDILLYYSGLRRDTEVPYRPFIGLAISRDGGRRFERVQEEPVVGPSDCDRLGASTPTVLREADGWSMVYSSFRAWLQVGAAQEPIYDLRRAVSPDGVNWTREEGVALGFEEGADGGLIRGQIFESPDGLRLLASERGRRNFRKGEGDGYRFVMAARSACGRRWQRTGERISFDHAAGDWDMDMQCYPCIVRHQDRRLVFYNGNDFGRHGFGVAELEWDEQ